MDGAEATWSEANGEQPQTGFPQQANQQQPAQPQKQGQNAMAMTEATDDIPTDFVYDTEHPEIPVPFTVQIGEERLEGSRISVAAAYVKTPVPLNPSFQGSRHVVKLSFVFEGFAITLTPEIVIAGFQDDEVKLQFIDPAGPHLPQLRYILNSYIAGDFVSLGAMMSYTGPAKAPQKKGDVVEDKRSKVRRIGQVAVSVCLIALAANVLWNRFSTSYEPRPVFIARGGSEMRATTGGQLTFLNPAAKEGEIVYSVAANSGDVLNFQMPCNCEIQVTDGVYEGATILPSDPILTFFDSNVVIRVQSQMSIEGLAKAMNGEQVYLDLEDGRSVPVSVSLTAATNAAAARGDLYLPVALVAEEGTLSPEDIGTPARVRLSRSLLGVL